MHLVCTLLITICRALQLQLPELSGPDPLRFLRVALRISEDYIHEFLIVFGINFPKNDLSVT